MIAWFIAPYKRQGGSPPARYCAMQDFDAQILADAGAWAETEVLGDCALVKVRATAGTLAAINAAPGFTRLPHAALNDPLSDLTPAERANLRDRLNAMGYPLQEIADVVGDLSTTTLGDVLRFAARRRLKPSYDRTADTIALNGRVQNPRPVANVNAAVQ